MVLSAIVVALTSSDITYFLFRRVDNPHFFVYNNSVRVQRMDKEKLKLIIKNLESLVDCLKSEVYSDVDSYKIDPQDLPVSDYDEVFYDDDDGYPD